MRERVTGPGGLRGVPGARPDDRYPPAPPIVLKLAREFPAVPSLALFRAVGKARRTAEQLGTLPDDTAADDIERLAREELRRWRPTHPLAAEARVATGTGWRYGD